MKKKEISKTYNLPYTIDHISKDTSHGRRHCHSMEPIYLTIHSTGNSNSTAKNEKAWLTNSANNRSASFHLVVDETEAIECIPLNEVAWHAGDGVNGTGNRKSIGLEICESGDRTKALNNAVSLAAKILRDNGWSTAKIIRHHDWIGKNCPRILIDPNSRALPHQTWSWFLA